MRPEKKEKVDLDEAFEKIGVPKEWIQAIKAMGYTTVASLKSFVKPGKLANDLNGYKKKHKLDLPGLSPEVIVEWVK